VSTAHLENLRAKIRPSYLGYFQHALHAKDGSEIRLRGDQEESVTNDFPLSPRLSFRDWKNIQPTFICALFFFLILEKSGGGGGPKKSNAYNRFMKSELKKLKEEFPDLDHVERSVCRLLILITLHRLVLIDGLLTSISSLQVQDGSCQLAQEEGRERSCKVQGLNDNLSLP